MRRAANAATSRSTAETSSRFAGPIQPTSAEVSPAPAMPPMVPPAPMNPNNRLPWLDVNTSAITDQKMDTTNMLNTDVHTKNTRPVHTCWPGGSQWSASKKRIRFAAKKR